MAKYVCKSILQLHFVHEFIDQLQSSLPEEPDSDSDQPPVSSICAIRLSVAAMGKEQEAPVQQLAVELPGQLLHFSVDSRSTHSFLDSKYMAFRGVSTTKPFSVIVAGGTTIQCSH